MQPLTAVSFSAYVGRVTLALCVCLLTSTTALSVDSPPPIVTNNNHQAAGVLRDGVLSVKLEIAEGQWHPEAEKGMTLTVYAFGEVGHPLQNPGPLIRVQQGTEIHASLHNALDVPVTVHGLGDTHPGDAGILIAPKETQEIKFTPSTPGLYFYWGASDSEDLKMRYGIDAELTGAFVVDPPAPAPDDEIFVMEMISEVPGLAARKTLATINGKSWPYTQHFQYEIGRQVRWRWINATNEPHALHLHGFYYHVDAFNRAGHVETYQGDTRPLVVTQRITQGETFDMSWSPDRSGQWLFHCHMFQHMTPPIVPEVPGLAITRTAVESSDHEASMNQALGMGQMVLGITVPESAKAKPEPVWRAERKLELEISERQGPPRYALRLHEGTNESASEPANPGLIGPPIVLTRGQPVEIEVLNNLKQPTAIHWHGIELESYYDGVPGWSGLNAQTTPLIAPGKSFTARMAPPRAGTFIYHTHWHEPSQLTNGIYGPLIVLPPGERFDPTSDLTFVFSIGDFGEVKEAALINGTPQSKTLQLQAGKKYRFRFINISTNNQGMQVSLRNSGGALEWVQIAKDAIDVPSNLLHPAKAQLTITVGETYDVEFSSAVAQDVLLDLLLPGQKIHTSQTLAFVSRSTD